MKRFSVQSSASSKPAWHGWKRSYVSLLGALFAARSGNARCRATLRKLFSCVVVYGIWLMQGEPCTARRLGVSDLQLRVKRLESFVREYTRCPCCDDERRCSPDCEHEINAPEQYREMVAAREALYGEEAGRE